MHINIIERIPWCGKIFIF